jgi:hypothetical protein
MLSEVSQAQKIKVTCFPSYVEARSISEMYMYIHIDNIYKCIYIYTHTYIYTYI